MRFILTCTVRLSTCAFVSNIWKSHPLFEAQIGWKAYSVWKSILGMDTVPSCGGISEFGKALGKVGFIVDEKAFLQLQHSTKLI